jgi:hypothetical protein
MKISKIIGKMDTLAKVYRICIARQNQHNPSITECRSLYNPNPRQPTIWTTLTVGKALPGKWYTATKAKFCLSYYTGCADIKEGEREVLLTLNVPAMLLPTDEEESYMGSEVIVENPLLVNIENTEEATTKEEYQ